MRTVAALYQDVESKRLAYLLPFYYPLCLA